LGVVEHNPLAINPRGKGEGKGNQTFKNTKKLGAVVQTEKGRTKKWNNSFQKSKGRNL